MITKIRELVRRGYHFAQSPETYSARERAFVIASLDDADRMLRDYEKLLERAIEYFEHPPAADGYDADRRAAGDRLYAVLKAAVQTGVERPE